MNKKTLGVILSVTILVIVALIAWGTRQQNVAPNTKVAAQSGDLGADIIYYYGQECSHCKNVEKFMADNKVEEKISLAKKEVWHSSDNDAELQEKAKECAFPQEKIGVPFLFARGKCYVGEIEVQDFLKKESGIQ